MHRVLRLWAILFPSFLVADQFTAVVGFRHFDLTFERFVAVVVVPLVQAVALVLLLEGARRSTRRQPRAVSSPFGRRLTAAFLVVDLLLLELAWLPVDALDGIDRFALLRLLVAAQALAGALVALRLALSGAMGRGQRVGLLIVAVVLSGAGISGLADWLSPLAALLGFALPEPVVRMLFVALPYAAAVASLAALRGAWQGRSPLAGRLLDWALSGAVGLALVVVLNLFWHPALPEFWRRVADSLALVAVGAVLVALVVVWRDGQEVPSVAGKPAPALSPACGVGGGRSWVAVAGLLVGSYLVARLATSLLVTGWLRFGLEAAVLAVVVPACQLGLLGAVGLYRRRRREAEERWRS